MPVTQVSAFQADTAKIRQIIDSVLLLVDTRQWEGARDLAQSVLTEMEAHNGYNIDYQSLMHNSVGDASLELGDLSSAKNHYEKSIKILEATAHDTTLAMAKARNKLGNYLLTVKDFEAALHQLELSRDILSLQQDEDDLYKSHIYNNLGVAYLNLGDFHQAQQYQEEALRLRSQILSPPNELLAQSHQNLAQCYQDAGQTQKAIEAYNVALRNYRSLGYTAGLTLADLYLNLGTAYYEATGEDGITMAIQYFRQALRIYEQEGNLAKSGIAVTYNNLANSYLQMGLPEEALHYYELAVNLRKEQYGKVHPDVGQSLFNLGQYYYLFLELNELAVQYFEDCLEALNYSKNADQLSQVNSYPILLYALYYRATAQFAIYRDSGSLVWLQRANESMIEVDQLLDFLRIRYEGLGSKYNLVANGHQMYDVAISVALELRQATGEEKYIHHALKYSEKSKGILLLDALQKSKAESFGNVPNSYLNEIKELEDSLARLEKERYVQLDGSNQSSATVDSLDRIIFNYQQEFEKRIRELSENYPKYFNLRYTQPIPSVAQLQHDLLQSDETLVEYFLGDTVLQIFVINDDDLKAFSIALSLEFFENLDTFNFSIREFRSVGTNEIQQNIESYVASARILYKYLISPIAHLLRQHLIIVPDGKLGFVAYDALLTGPVKDPSTFRDHPYLVRNHPISYNYSASLLVEMSANKSGKKLDTYLGFAPSFMAGNEKGLSQLFFNKEEITQASALFGGEVFADQRATKANFIKHQNKYQIVHLATHGKVNVSQQDYSFLAFTQDGGEESEENILYVREIYNLPIAAKLIILSACETGDGKLFEGEGVASIARGFSYAGAESMLATRWPINDKTTSMIVSQLLSNLKEGIPKDEALHQATISYINSQNHHYAHPFYWSSFMVVGDMQHLVFSLTPHWFIATLLISLVLLATVMIIRKSAEKRTVNSLNSGSGSQGKN